MLYWDSEIVIWSIFVNCELWTCDMNSTIGSVVPLAIFFFLQVLICVRRRPSLHLGKPLPLCTQGVFLKNYNNYSQLTLYCKYLKWFFKTYQKDLVLNFFGWYCFIFRQFVLTILIISSNQSFPDENFYHHGPKLLEMAATLFSTKFCEWYDIKTFSRSLYWNQGYSSTSLCYISLFSGCWNIIV